MPRPRDHGGKNWIGRKPGNYKWYEIQDAVDYYEAFNVPKIVYPDIAKSSRMAFDGDGLFLTNTVYFIPSSDLYLLGILNSRLIFEYFKRVATVLGDAEKGGRLRWFSQDVAKLPIHRVDQSNLSEVIRRDRMVSMVELMLRLHKDLVAAKTDQEKTRFHRQIDATDKQIDALVYELYGLTEEEIKIVEGNVAG